jgi:hypothetical protein
MGAWRPKHVEWLRRNKTRTVLHRVGVSFDLYYDARKRKIKIPVYVKATMLVTAEAYLGGPFLQLLAPTGIVLSTVTRIKCSGS